MQRHHTIALAYCTAKCPRPPPAPGKTLNRVSQIRRSDIYTHDPLPRLDSASLAGDISCNSSAHDRASFFVRNAFWNSSCVSSVAQCILLKSASSAEAGILLLGTMKLVGAVGAELARSTSTPHPLDAGSVSYFPFMMHIVPNGDDDTSTLMSCDTPSLRLHGNAESSPFILDQRLVRST